VANTKARKATKTTKTTKANNNFCSIDLCAKTGPIFAARDGRVDSVILSAKKSEEAIAVNLNQSHKKNPFESDYADWLKEQNIRFEKQGLWCDDISVW
jgi:hypothetical protein